MNYMVPHFTGIFSRGRLDFHRNRFLKHTKFCAPYLKLCALPFHPVFTINIFGGLR